MICWAILSLFVFAPQQQAPEFEVASVKLSKGPQKGAPRVLFLDGAPGKLRSVGEPLFVLLMQAYDVGRNAVDGPAWLNDVNIDVAAKTPAGATPDQLRLMLQRLLQERFALTAHRETRAKPAYVLTIAKGGIKFKENRAPDLKPIGPGVRSGRVWDRDGFPIIPAHLSGGASHNAGSVGKFTAVAATMETMLPLIAAQLEDPHPRIVDRTGLTGKYDFHLEYQLNGQPPPREFGAPQITEALEKQLGLHLEKTKVPLEMLIVDHIERTPTDN